MRTMLLLAMLALAVLLVFTWNGDDAKPTPDHVTSKQPAAGSVVEQPGMLAKGSSVAQGGPVLGHVRVTIDKDPAHPQESAMEAKYRADFAEHFDTFVRESGVTDKQVQALLLALYDYQEQSRSLEQDYVDGVIRNEVPRGKKLWAQAAMSLYDDLERDIALVLSEHQQRVWGRVCGFCPSYLDYSHRARVLTLDAAGHGQTE